MSSPLQRMRQEYEPDLPELLEVSVSTRDGEPLPPKEPSLQERFEHLHTQNVLTFTEGEMPCEGLYVGVVLSGGQAPGGHNVITGLFDSLPPGSTLYGFVNGPSGIVSKEAVVLTGEMIDEVRNTGGFDLIGSGRTKIETEEQFAQALKTCNTLDLDGLVVIGGDDSNTNAALLAEYFKAKGSSCRVVGVPKTIDGDLRNPWVEISFGCDTACKEYSSTIGSIARDALSAKKYYYFIKLMGRSASYITLECALQTHPNVTLIGEEIQSEEMTFRQVVEQIADVVCQRAVAGKDYGVVLIPEGVIEFIPEFSALIQELNTLLASVAPETAPSQLSEGSKGVFDALPMRIQEQLLMDRDPHGNVQVSKIETERLFMEAVKEELSRRKEAGLYSGKFSGQPMFCGYEGRSVFPSNFDAQYCYALGHVATLLIRDGRTGYMAALRGLSRPVSEWEPCGVPLVGLMQIEMRHGQEKPVIEKAMVDLSGAAFRKLQEMRAKWATEDDYQYPGPIQYWGPEALTEARLISLTLEASMAGAR